MRVMTISNAMLPLPLDWGNTLATADHFGLYILEPQSDGIPDRNDHAPNS